MITIVIPTINEEKNINRTLKIIYNAKDFKNSQIIIVDDGSTDNTVKIVNSFKKKMDIFLIRNKKKLGLGFALKKGFKNAKFSNVMFLDADLSIKLKDILRIVKYKNKNTMIIGSRYLRKSKIIGANYIKVKLSFILNYLISKLYNLKIIDISHSF